MGMGGEEGMLLFHRNRQVQRGELLASHVLGTCGQLSIALKIFPGYGENKK